MSIACGCCALRTTDDGHNHHRVRQFNCMHYSCPAACPYNVDLRGIHHSNGDKNKKAKKHKTNSRKCGAERNINNIAFSAFFFIEKLLHMPIWTWFRIVYAYAQPEPRRQITCNYDCCLHLITNINNALFGPTTEQCSFRHWIYARKSFIAAQRRTQTTEIHQTTPATRSEQEPKTKIFHFAVADNVMKSKTLWAALAKERATGFGVLCFWLRSLKSWLINACGDAGL